MNLSSGDKVLLVITKSNWGGAQAYVYALASRLHSEGIPVAVALGGTGLPGAQTGLLAERLEAAGVRTIVLPSFRRDISIGAEFRAFGELYSIIRKERPTVLHLNSSKAGGLGALAGRLAGVRKILYTAHGWAHREPRSSLKRLLVRISSWVTILLCHRVIVVSSLDYTDAPVLFSHRKLVLIRNGMESFWMLDKDDARQKLATGTSLPTAGQWILMQAELHRNKGIDIAIDGFSQIAEKHPEASLVVLGSGEERDSLTEQIHKLNLQDRVFLLGFIPDSRTYLKAGDIFLMPSRKEGLPLALLEAGMASLPVIASDVGGIPEVIENGKSGIFVPSQDSGAIAKALEFLLSDQTVANSFGEALHSRVQEEFSEKRMLDETISIYKS